MIQLTKPTKIKEDKVLINARIDQSLYDAVYRAADEAGISLSEAVRQILSKALIQV